MTSTERTDVCDEQDGEQQHTLVEPEEDREAVAQFVEHNSAAEGASYAYLSSMSEEFVEQFSAMSEGVAQLMAPLGRQTNEGGDPTTTEATSTKTKSSFLMKGYPRASKGSWKAPSFGKLPKSWTSFMQGSSSSGTSASKEAENPEGMRMGDLCITSSGLARQLHQMIEMLEDPSQADAIDQTWVHTFVQAHQRFVDIACELETGMVDTQAEVERLHRVLRHPLVMKAMHGQDILQAQEPPKLVDEETQRRAEQEAKRRTSEVERKAAEEVQRRVDEEAKRKAAEEAQRKIEEDQQAQEEAQRKEEETKRIADEEARRKAEEERHAQEEAQKKEEEARRAADEEARRKEEAEAEERRKAFEEAQRKQEEAKLAADKKAQEETQRKEEEEAKRAADEAKRATEESAEQKVEEESKPTVLPQVQLDGIAGIDTDTLFDDDFELPTSQGSSPEKKSDTLSDKLNRRLDRLQTGEVAQVQKVDGPQPEGKRSSMQLKLEARRKKLEGDGWQDD